MAQKKKIVAKRTLKKPTPVKAGARGKVSDRKGAKTVKKKASPTKRPAPSKKKVAAKKAPVAIPKPVAKKPSTQAPKKALTPAPRKLAASASVASAKSRPSTAAVTTVGKKPVDTASSPIKPATQSEVAPVVEKPSERKPLKDRVVMEFEVHSNPNVLFELLSTPSGFSEWYCDDVDVRGDVFTFKWGNDEEVVTMIGRKAPEVIRFRRIDDDDPAAFFEFRIRIDDMTNEVALIVTDHAWPGESGNVRSLWASQIANLTRVLGA